ncbi:polymorphic toxin type 28 domain-containing protein [Paenibacillus sp. PAMC 26794]|uniref:RHS repeat-associated core domain-containing protein n=1 Tax=Paenibacillus sp. PAMC 26794 TaxID=1257080 RepID=UPI00187BE981|nr:polymorphic toxin type 28 domain-containing protein [Paenibacillus sp. PAMC 26794]
MGERILGLRLSIETNIRGSKTYAYDAFNRVLRQQDGTSTTQMVYAARTLTITDGENNRIRETYNVMGQVTKKEELKASGNVILATYTYDSVGNVISVTDGNGNLTTNSYDALSRLSSVTDAENKKTSYTYNLGDDLTKVTYADGKTVQKRYDEMGRLLVQTDPLGQVTTYTYDANDNVTKVLDRKGQERSYVYNSRNFLLENRASDGTISYTYDAMGRRTVMGDPTGSTQYAYTPVGELESITYSDGATLTMSYDARGTRTRQTFQQGSYTLNLGMSYKGASVLPASLNLTNGSGTTLGSFAYTYRGNNTLAQQSTGSGWKETYMYNGLNLIGLTHTFQGTNGPSYSYAYDNNRNITSKTDEGIASQFTYDKLNRVHTSSPYQETYTYDVRDNRSGLESDREWNPPVPASYTYDARNQLTGATVNAQTVSYRYNGDGLMTERSTGGQTTRYYYDDRGLLVAEGTVSSTGTAQITVGYVYDATGKLTARQMAGESQLQSYVTNGHGDVTEIRDASGNILNRYTYDIWGNPEMTEETVPNVLRYAGEYWDDVTGLQYLRARWYDPSTARFINEDTVEGELTNPLSLNLYTYVENNPLIYVDSSGESKRPAKNSLEGLGAGSGSASAGAGRSSGGGFGGGGSKGGSSGSKPSTSNKGQSTKETPKSSVVKELSRAMKKNLKTLDNIVNKHLTEKDFSGTLRDLQGNPVPKPEGGYWNHLHEMQNSYQGLIKIKRGLTGSLQNPNLSGSVKKTLQDGLDKANKYLKKIEDLFEPFGGIK